MKIFGALMGNKVLLILGLLLLTNGKTVIAQHSINMAIICDAEPPMQFSFTKHWAYPWYVVKDDSGKFSSDVEGKITAKDTVHVYFTANCKTNVQGSHGVNYCQASKKRKNIKLNFIDAMPAYLSGYEVFITPKGFSFKPNIISPIFDLYQAQTYNVAKSKLILYQKDYENTAMLSGYIDVEFTEILTTSTKKESHKYYFRGYFKTPVKS